MTDITRPDTSNRPEGLEVVKAGQHGHWSAYDLGLEGTRYHALDLIVHAVPFDTSAAETLAEEIVAFGQGYGYGQADSFESEKGTMTDEEVEEDVVMRIMRDSLFSSYDETEYFDNTYKSETALMAACATKEALAFSRGLSGRVTAAFKTGRDMYFSEHPAAEADEDVDDDADEVSSPSM